jgi:hypothetical protein
MFKVHMKQIDKDTKVSRIIQTWPGFESKEAAQAFMGGNGGHQGSIIVSPMVAGQQTIAEIEEEED